MAVAITSKSDYAEYLESPEWKNKAREAKSRAGWRCQICGVESHIETLDGHHRDYSKIGTDAELLDVIAVCRPCHAMIHGQDYNPPARFK